jgi:hypothetical protein
MPVTSNQEDAAALNLLQQALMKIAAVAYRENFVATDVGLQ